MCSYSYSTFCILVLLVLTACSTKSWCLGFLPSRNVALWIPTNNRLVRPISTGEEMYSGFSSSSSSLEMTVVGRGSSSAKRTSRNTRRQSRLFFKDLPPDVAAAFEESQENEKKQQQAAAAEAEAKKLKNQKMALLSETIEDMAVYLSIELGRAYVWNRVQEKQRQEEEQEAAIQKKRADASMSVVQNLSLIDSAATNKSNDDNKDQVEEGKNQQQQPEMKFVGKALQEDEKEKVRPSLLHEKRGDRVVAIKDEFSPDTSISTEGDDNDSVAPRRTVNDNDKDETTSPQSFKVGQPLSEETKESETPSLLHKKAGDRNVALKDEFAKTDNGATDLTEATTTLSSSSATPPPLLAKEDAKKRKRERNVALQDEFPDEVSNNNNNNVNASNETTATTKTATILTPPPTRTTTATAASTTTNVETPTAGTRSALLIPRTPDIVSSAFGKPLEVLDEGIPPVQKEMKIVKPTTTAVVTKPSVTAQATETTLTDKKSVQKDAVASSFSLQSAQATTAVEEPPLSVSSESKPSAATEASSSEAVEETTTTKRLVPRIAAPGFVITDDGRTKPLQPPPAETAIPSSGTGGVEPKLTTTMTSSSSLVADAAAPTVQVPSPARTDTTTGPSSESLKTAAAAAEPKAKAKSSKKEEANEDEETRRLREEAARILFDLGLAQEHPNPKDENYDASADNDWCPENSFKGPSSPSQPPTTKP